MYIFLVKIDWLPRICYTLGGMQRLKEDSIITKENQSQMEWDVGARTNEIVSFIDTYR